MLLIILVGQEILFRAMFPIPEIEKFNRIRYQQMAQSPPEIGKAMERGLVYGRLLLESSPDGFSFTHDLNIYGFRGPDFRADPTPGRRRIVVVGDSVVEGQGASGSDTITAEWSRLLTRDGIDAEVINLGVIAATLPHIWILTRDAVRLLQPTDVVVALYPNDLPAPFIPNAFNLPPPQFPRAPDAAMEPRLVDLIDRMIYEKPIHRRWFHLPMRGFLPAPDGSNPFSLDQECPKDLRPDLFEAMKTARLNPWLYAQSKEIGKQLAHDFSQGGTPRDYLAAMADVCAQFRAKLYIAYNPFCGVVNPRYAPALIDAGMDPEIANGLAVDPKYRNQNRVVAEICQDLKLPLADSTEALRAAEADGPQFWLYDTHPNAAGYATIARGLHEMWKAENSPQAAAAPTGTPPS